MHFDHAQTVLGEKFECTYCEQPLELEGGYLGDGRYGYFLLAWDEKHHE